MGNGHEQMFQILLFFKCHEDRSLTTDLAMWWSLMILLGVLHFSAVLKVRSKSTCLEWIRFKGEKKESYRKQYIKTTLSDNFVGKGSR